MPEGAAADDDAAAAAAAADTYDADAGTDDGESPLVMLLIPGNAADALSLLPPTVTD